MALRIHIAVADSTGAQLGGYEGPVSVPPAFTEFFGDSTGTTLGGSNAGARDVQAGLSGPPWVQGPSWLGRPSYDGVHGRMIAAGTGQMGYEIGCIIRQWV